ncbi:MAG: FAD-dependent oxidoreductase [Actinomycetota bacterium]|nr:FAD-dependent oxidoreductase [Actinomycetota bacterium]
MGQRLVVVGGDGAGMAAASVARRRNPDMEIVALEKGPWTSYSACGIPYLIGGEVGHLEDLISRPPEKFREVRIDVRTGHEATGIDLDARTVEAYNMAHDRTYRLGFDLLHLATGAVPRRPPIPGLDAAHVHGVQTLADARDLLADAADRRPEHVVVVGSGYIGLELAESFLQRGASVTVVEQGPEVLPALDPEMGTLVSRAMRSMGINLRLGEVLEEVEDSAVRTSAGTIPADLVVLGMGVSPNSELAMKAGLTVGLRDAIVVDRQQRTSAEGVYAAGDCCQSINIISGLPAYSALGTVANKQGRVAGINLSSGYATFPGVAGTAVTRICRTEIGRTGLNTKEATAAGFGFVTKTIETTGHAGYMPDADLMTVRMLAEKGTGRLLGVQIVGGPGAAKRVDVVAASLAAGFSVEDLMMLDLGYAPPFSSTWDPVQVAARALIAEL